MFRTPWSRGGHPSGTAAAAIPPIVGQPFGAPPTPPTVGDHPGRPAGDPPGRLTPAKRGKCRTERASQRSVLHLPRNPGKMSNGTGTDPIQFLISPAFRAKCRTDPANRRRILHFPRQARFPSDTGQMRPAGGTGYEPMSRDRGSDARSGTVGCPVRYGRMPGQVRSDARSGPRRTPVPAPDECPFTNLAAERTGHLPAAPWPMGRRRDERRCCRRRLHSGTRPGCLPP